MAAADPLNLTHTEDPAVQVQPPDCCSTTGTISDENFLQLDDSTRLVGVQVILILAYSTIILFGVLGNSLVIYVVYKFKKLQTVTNFFIVNLAVSDLLVNTLCLPFTLVNTLYGEWTYGHVLCFLLPWAQGMAVHVSTITLNVIALDRHRSIVHHKTKTKMSKDMCAVVIITTWTVSALLASPLAIFREYGTFELSPYTSIQVCTENWPGNMSGSIYSISMFLLQYGLPLAINIFAYVRIWNKMKNQMTYGGRSDHHHQRRKRTTKMLVTMVVVFAVSWLPLHAFQLAVDINSSVLTMKDFKLLFTLFHIAAMCSTFVNPILYGWMNKNYRAAFLSVCECKWPLGMMSRCANCGDVQKEEDKVCMECRWTHVDIAVVQI